MLREGSAHLQNTAPAWRQCQAGFVTLVQRAELMKDLMRAQCSGPRPSQLTWRGLPGQSSQHCPCTCHKSRVKICYTAHCCCAAQKRCKNVLQKHESICRLGRASCAATAACCAACHSCSDMQPAMNHPCWQNLHLPRHTAWQEAHQ